MISVPNSIRLLSKDWMKKFEERTEHIKIRSYKRSQLSFKLGTP